jgi:arginine exporter protein ArgO
LSTSERWCWAGRPVRNRRRLQAVWVLAAFVASASWQLLIAGGGRLIGRLLTGARGRLTTALVSSAVIFVLAVGLVLP